MTQHKVVADDSLAAMDEISRVLGKDAVILKTQKVNGKIEIVGSNNIEDIASSNAKKMNKQKNSFVHLFSNHNLEKDNQIRKYNTIIQNQNIKEDINSDKSSEIKCDDFDKNYVDMETFKIFTTKIENLLKNKNTKQSIFYHKIMNLISIKKQNKAFHPNAKRENLNMGKKIFCFKRTSLDKKQVIYNITNLSSKHREFNYNKKFDKYKNLLNKSKISCKSELRPFETLWLSN